MNFEDYQSHAHETAINKSDLYPLVAIAGEAGEIADKLAKILRKRGYPFDLTPKEREDILDECGDALWDISEICTLLNASLNDVALNNLTKLKYREQNGELDRMGENR